MRKAIPPFDFAHNIFHLSDIGILNNDSTQNIVLRRAIFAEVKTEAAAFINIRGTPWNGTQFLFTDNVVNRYLTQIITPYASQQKY